MISEAFKVSFKRATLYRANLISWILADISLYTGTFLTYWLLTSSINSIGGYFPGEIMLYISSFLLVNNVFAAFFSDAVSEYLSQVLSGKLHNMILKPRHLIMVTMLSNINFPPLITTPFLLFINIFYLRAVNGISIQYYLLIVSGAITMGFLYFTLYSFGLLGFRMQMLSDVIFQLMQVSERPDTVFPYTARNILTYIIPVFLFSAVPTRYALGKINYTTFVWALSAPVVHFVLLMIIIKVGLSNYREATH
ncbi:MAG: hypothetical protein DDT23_01208 [candidate division WS2 bacterium]|nr:hypothetical protein [Candidatus Lithacetigena glycinireducens]